MKGCREWQLSAVNLSAFQVINVQHSNLTQTYNQINVVPMHFEAKILITEVTFYATEQASSINLHKAYYISNPVFKALFYFSYLHHCKI